MYAKFFKRLIDFTISLIALIILLPIMVIFVVVGAIVMKGNPFFTQLRPGKDEKIFRLIKFRTMTQAKDKNGELLPDAERLTAYGQFLRKTSIDELPELINILKGDMALVGPRPLVPQYLPYYTDEERHRHDVRPGLGGLAQVNGRNGLQWEERFAYDLEYINNITFMGDMKIIFLSIKKSIMKEDIVVRGTGKTIDFDAYRKAQLQENKREEGTTDDIN